MLSPDTPSNRGISTGGRLRYELLTIGDELLLGLTANGHLEFIGAQLGARGIELRRNVTVTDDALTIREKGSDISVKREDVVRVSTGSVPKRGEQALIGLVIGGGIGAGIGAIATSSHSSFCCSSKGIGALVGIVIGAPIGAIVGAVAPAHTTIYRAKQSAAPH